MLNSALRRPSITVTSVDQPNRCPHCEWPHVHRLLPNTSLAAMSKPCGIDVTIAGARGRTTHRRRLRRHSSATPTTPCYPGTHEPPNPVADVVAGPLRAPVPLLRADGRCRNRICCRQRRSAVVALVRAVRPRLDDRQTIRSPDDRCSELTPMITSRVPISTLSEMQSRRPCRGGGPEREFRPLVPVRSLRCCFTHWSSNAGLSDDA
jgi:hypothetical protein